MISAVAALTAAAVAAVSFRAADAFTPKIRNLSSPTTFQISRQQQLGASTSSSTTETTESPCTVAEDNQEQVDKATAQSLRSATVVNARGERVSLGQVMKDGTSIVVFLRHMG